MIRLRTAQLAGITIAASLLFSCSDNLRKDRSWRKDMLPEHFPAPVYSINPDTLSEEEVALGRDLFYDNLLSSDSSISCGTCHAQTHAFAGHGTPISAGVHGRLGTRNTPGLSNLAWHSSYMLDGGINHLDLVPIAPITAFVEMDLALNEAVHRLNSSAYKARFQRIYNTDSVHTKVLMKALTAFQLTLVSADSKYDRVLLGDSVFTEEEAQGEVLFQSNCASCHTPPLFSDFSYSNHGFEWPSIDAGRGRITLTAEDSGAFKVPSLRNAALTHPYMHDGSVYSLEQVLDRYSDEILVHSNLDPRIEGPMHFSDEEKAALIAFIQTLTDYTLTTNPRHSAP